MAELRTETYSYSVRSGNGTVQAESWVEPTPEGMAYGSAYVRLTATPSPGWRFDHWELLQTRLYTWGEGTPIDNTSYSNPLLDSLYRWMASESTTLLSMNMDYAAVFVLDGVEPPETQYSRVMFAGEILYASLSDFDDWAHNPPQEISGAEKWGHVSVMAQDGSVAGFGSYPVRTPLSISVVAGETYTLAGWRLWYRADEDGPPTDLASGETWPVIGNPSSNPIEYFSSPAQGHTLWVAPVFIRGYSIFCSAFPPQAGSLKITRVNGGDITPPRSVYILNQGERNYTLEWSVNSGYRAFALVEFSSKTAMEDGNSDPPPPLGEGSHIPGWDSIGPKKGSLDFYSSYERDVWVVAYFENLSGKLLCTGSDSSAGAGKMLCDSSGNLLYDG